MRRSIATNLQGKRGLVVGIANDASIAAGCARAFSPRAPNSPRPI
jgi:enoyl-[acyl-carrier-protein] reductase (NADH)